MDIHKNMFREMQHKFLKSWRPLMMSAYCRSNYLFTYWPKFFW